MKGNYMKYCLLSVSKRVKSVNIGDYIQALASSQFLPSVDGFVEREELRDYDGEDCNMIMNGWYMHFPVQWPPSSKIHPLFVAFHINILAKERMLMADSIDYLKRYEPIGCRDIATRDMLLASGVDAYFSGCMTLTLGHKYKYNGDRSGVYFVDPVVRLRSRIEKIKWILRAFAHPLKVKHLFEKRKKRFESFLHRIAFASKFFYVYRKYFTDETLLNATFKMQEGMEYKDDYFTEESRLQAAAELVKAYSKAALVVTSRIHCALPCLGIETPVIYLYDDSQAKVSTCRLDGLLDLFNIIHVDDMKFYSTDIDLSSKIDCNINIRNKEKWRQYCDGLIDRCSRFIQG